MKRRSLETYSSSGCHGNCISIEFIFPILNKVLLPRLRFHLVFLVKYIKQYDTNYSFLYFCNGNVYCFSKTAELEENNIKLISEGELVTTKQLFFKTRNAYCPLTDRTCGDCHQVSIVGVGWVNLLDIPTPGREQVRVSLVKKFSNIDIMAVQFIRLT